MSRPIEQSQKTISERLLDCFPSGTYALTGLLRLLDVVESSDIATAAVECCQQPRLLINPGFVDRWAATPEKLLMLVMHELHHVLLGHTRLLRRITKVDNLVFDAVINSLLCRMFPEPSYTSFYCDYYSDERFPECLLRPPAGWRPGDEVTLPPALVQLGNKELAETYRGLYSERGVGYEELRAAMEHFVNEQMAFSVILIGDHRGITLPITALDSQGPVRDDPLSEQDQDSGQGSACGELEQRSPLLLEIVREIIERWPPPADPIVGRSWSQVLQNLRVKPRHKPSNREVLKRLLRRVADRRNERGRVTREGDDPTVILTPVPKYGRREVVLRSLGCQPMLFHDRLITRNARVGDEPVHVYVDVSGSIGNLRGSLYGAVLDCRELVAPAIHLFSTTVVDISLSQLRNGKCESTFGTSIHCVAEHMDAKKIKRAVLITDGYVGQPRGAIAKTLSAARLGVALTPNRSTKKDLQDVTDHWATLTDSKK